MLPGAVRPAPACRAPVLRTCSKRYATAVGASSQAASKAANSSKAATSGAKSDRVVEGAPAAAPLRYPVAMRDPDWYDPQKIEEVSDSDDLRHWR
jgi:hypothetical protein